MVYCLWSIYWLDFSFAGNVPEKKCTLVEFHWLMRWVRYEEHWSQPELTKFVKESHRAAVKDVFTLEIVFERSHWGRLVFLFFCLFVFAEVTYELEKNAGTGTAVIHASSITQEFYTIYFIYWGVSIRYLWRLESELQSVSMSTDRWCAQSGS